MDQRRQEQGTRRLGDTGAQSSRCTLTALHKLQHLRTEAARKTTQIVNATILEDDRAALNIVLLAGDSEWLEAWRQKPTKYEPKMRAIFAGQLMSILSFSLQGDASRILPAWEREIATLRKGQWQGLGRRRKDRNVPDQGITAENAPAVAR